jgi:hypothetical protein
VAKIGLECQIAIQLGSGYDFQKLKRAGKCGHGSRQQHSASLVASKDRMDTYCMLKEGCKDAGAWSDRVQKLEKETGWPECPQEILK